MPSPETARVFLKQKLIWAFVVKLMAIGLMFYFFFSPDQRLNPNLQQVEQHLLLPAPSSEETR